METSPGNTTPKQPGLWSRVFRWRTLRWIILGIAGLFTLGALVWTEENWRGKHDWLTFKAEWEAKGEHFDLDYYTPKPVPPEQNFVATPFLAPMLNYRIDNGDVVWGDSNGIARIKSVEVENVPSADITRQRFCDLAAAAKSLRSNTNFPAAPDALSPPEAVLFALRKFDPVISELKTASQRPFAVYSVDRPDEGIPAFLEQFGMIKSLTRFVCLRASANLGAGKTEEALSDIQLGFSLARSLRNEPQLISQLVRLAILTMAVQPAWEGLARHQWNEAQLQELQKLLSGVHLLDDYGVAMRGERAFNNEMTAIEIAGRFPAVAGVEIKPSSMPVFRGLFYQNQLVLNRLYQTHILPAVDPAAHRVHPEMCSTNALAGALGRVTPYNIFAQLSALALTRPAARFAWTQTLLDEANIACAIERYRLTHARYSDSLDQLAPQFIDKLPPDIIGGQPMHYQRASDGSFVLYSIGWNGTDDGGVTDPKAYVEKGDWVWKYPAK